MIKLCGFLELQLWFLPFLFVISNCNGAFLCTSWSKSCPNRTPLKRSSIFHGDSKQQKNEDTASVKDSQIERQARIEEGNYNYEKPAFSPSFQAFMATLKTPSQPSALDDEGVACTGEPSTDPSRSLQNFGGMDSEWIEDAVVKDEEEF